jgi:ABC-type uncharacterized transport system YnjBCD ATPase subunit
MADIVLDQVTKRYPDGALAVDHIDLDVADGEFVILVGPSGCGKSTTLNMIAGLEDISDGELRIGGQVVNNKAPKDRDIAMVFQSYALYPHMTVRENMAFGLKLRKFPKAEITQRVEHAARILDITELLERRPKALSARQRMRSPLEILGQPELARRLGDALRDLGLWQAAPLQAEGHVVEHVHMRVERIGLEHHGDVAVLGGDVVDDPAVDPDRARGDRLEPGDHPQHRGFAAARGAEQHHELAIGDGERDRLDGRHRAVRIGLAEPVDGEARHARSRYRTAPAVMPRIMVSEVSA